MGFLYIVILPLVGILALWGVGTIAYGYWEGLHNFESISDVNAKNKLFEFGDFVEHNSDFDPAYSNIPTNVYHSMFDDD